MFNKNLHKISFITLLFAFILQQSSCNVAGGSGTFSKDGLSFQIPQGWAITNQDTIGNEGVYVACEKKGFGETTFASFTWMYGEFDIDRNIQIQRDAILQNPLFLKWRTQITDPQKSNFAQYAALKCTYTTRLKDQEVRGDIYCFNCGNKAITVMWQGTANDLITDAEAWQQIRESFRCANK